IGMMIHMRFMLGVDEAGRGPLAGPVAIGVVAVPERFLITREFPGLVDSKQMSPLAREKTFKILQGRVRSPPLLRAVSARSRPLRTTFPFILTGFSRHLVNIINRPSSAGTKPCRLSRSLLSRQRWCATA